jgi:hypothetical protein
MGVVVVIKDGSTADVRVSGEDVLGNEGCGKLGGTGGGMEGDDVEGGGEPVGSGRVIDGCRCRAGLAIVDLEEGDKTIGLRVA